MAGSVYDSALYAQLFGDKEVGPLFTDSAEIRALVLVEGALAKAQGKLGVIPQISAAAIHRASLEIPLDPAGLAEGTGKSGVMIPALVAAFRKAMEAPEHAQFVHFGATSQDIVDTGLALRLRQVLGIYETRLQSVIAALGQLANTHAELPMAARTWGQNATPTTFGAVVATWGAPLIQALEALPAVRAQVQQVSLSGAAGTLSAMGPKGPEVRRDLAEGLGLSDPEQTWHSNRFGVTSLAAWMTQTTAALAKLARDIDRMTQSGIGELIMGTAGSSSTMPQKQNPVVPAQLQAIASHVNGLNHVMQSSAVHGQARDGSAWMAEWMSLPQMCLGTGTALKQALDLITGLQPMPQAMRANLENGLGLIYAESLTFLLAKSMRRPEAQEAVKTLCQRSIAEAIPLAELAASTWPDLDLATAFQPHSTWGNSALDAKRFAAAALSLSNS
ncbi:class-II fumarase/aspartase family protein [Algirhabdus cladophorae]|uniref:class-II fumarase/aspartase family protein n=1 Tax=Algirhabdus cladophorae TaxID=3377108 RepID=UPI003B84B73B